ncbi:MAG TPA: sterol desaturase family protein [Candidatus Binatia bacterium]|nr:sterol desaturase family protein [Candidatus Binatia bacterium]
MLNALLAPYRAPLFLSFGVGAPLVSMAAFALFAGPLTWLAAVDAPTLRRWRIQKRPPRAQQLVGPSLRSWATNNLWALAGNFLAWPLLARSGIHGGPLPSWWTIALQLLFFVYLDDFLYYWFHRAMHAPWLYRRIHGRHHRIVTPWAVTDHYMHPLEYGLTGAVAVVGPLLVGAHVVTVWLWFVVRQWEPAEGHSGYDLPWTPTHWLPGNDGAMHRDVHHARVRGNYAGYLTLWDGVFGTCARGYAEELAARGAPRAAAA